MDTKKLRQKILDLAIRGKLVPQDPNDEPASVLLERIRAEKERLIAEGKIKRPKKAKASAENHYQQFEIPNTWVWTTLGEIFSMQAGKSIHSQDLSSFSEHSPYPCYGGNGIRGFMPRFSHQGTYPIIGRQGALCGNINIAQGRFYATEHAVVVECFANTNTFLWAFFLEYLNLNQYATSTAQPGLSVAKIEEVPIPLPPIEEQVRIVSNIYKWFGLIEHISKSITSLSDTISLTKSKILDLAMQGKLVPQDPTDEPAADILRRINPKAKIIADNPHYPQLPDNWVLTRIKDVFEVNPKNKASNNIQAGFVPMASIHDGYSNKFHYDVKQWGEIKSGFTHFADGDIAVAKISPCLENRKSMILRELPNGIGAGTTELLIFRSTILIPEFSLLFFKSNNFIKCCTGTFNGVVGQQRVGKSIVEEIHIPIPPLNIQRTIVQRVQEWFNCLDNILVSISK